MTTGYTYTYTWDHWDRMRSAQNSHVANLTNYYDYDAQGRLLRKYQTSTGTLGSITHNYWLGLNKIAEEEATTSTLIFRPDTEASGSPSANGCGMRSPARIR